MTTRAAPRLVRGCLVACLLAVVAVHAPAATAEGACGHVRATGVWRSIDPPTLNAEIYPDPGRTNGLFALDNGATVTATAPDAGTGGRTQAFRQSLDGGCTWKAIFSTADVASMLAADPSLYSADPGYLISQVLIPDSHEPPARQHLYLVLSDPTSGSTLAPVSPIAIAVSGDGGGTWQVHAPGPADLLQHDTACGPVSETIPSRIVVAPGDPRVLYLLCVQAGLTSAFENYIYSNTGQDPLWNKVMWLSSTDSGKTWRRASVVADGFLDAETNYYGRSLLDVAVDPLDANSVWVTLETNYPGAGNFIYAFTVFHSQDGARTFKEVTTAPFPHGMRNVELRHHGLVVTRTNSSAPANVSLWAGFDVSDPNQTTTSSAPTKRLAAFGWVFTSMTGGASWTPLETSRALGPLTEIAGVAVRSPTQLFILIDDWRHVTCRAASSAAATLDIRSGHWSRREPPTLTPGGVILEVQHVQSVMSPAGPAALADVRTGAPCGTDPSNASDASAALQYVRRE